MGVIGIPFNETARRIIAQFLVFIYGIIALAGIGIALFGVYMKVVIDKFMVLLEGYNPGTLPYLLISVGSVMFALGLAGGKICFDCSGPEKRKMYQGFFFAYVLVVLTFSFVLLASALAVRFHTVYADIALHRGKYIPS